MVTLLCSRLVHHTNTNNNQSHDNSRHREMSTRLKHWENVAHARKSIKHGSVKSYPSYCATGRSWAQAAQLATSMLKRVRVFLMVSLKRFFCSPSELTLQELVWQAAIRHPCHEACPSHLSFLHESVNARDACSCEGFCVGDHVLPLDARNNSQTFCIEVVEFSWRDGCTQSMTHVHRSGRLAPETCTPLVWCLG